MGGGMVVPWFGLALSYQQSAISLKQKLNADGCLPVSSVAGSRMF